MRPCVACPMAQLPGCLDLHFVLHVHDLAHEEPVIVLGEHHEVE